MKKTMFSIYLLFIFIGVVSADDLNPNVVISEEGYEILSEYMSDTEMAMINQDIYDMFMEGNVVSYQSMIVETTYYESPTQLPQVVSERHMTVDEYANTPSTLATECFYTVDYNTYDCETDMKYLVLATHNNDGVVRFEMYNVWKSMPKYKSFDVIGMRWTGNFTYDSYYGEQNNDGNSGRIQYLVGNGNYKFGTNAIGLSQNLVDSATVIDNRLSVVGSCTTAGNVYASYQHAKTNVTLATSKKYNFSASGMGGVFGFYDGVGNYYDDSPALHLNYSCS